MSEINPTDHKSITARNIPQNNTLVEADFSIWRDYAPSKRHYRVHHVWCQDPENTKDFFERIWEYQVKKYYIANFFRCIDSCYITRIFIFCCINSCSITRILQDNDVPLLHRAACKEFVSLVQKAFRDSCNRHLLLYSVEPNPSTPCKRRRSIDSSTSDFASLSPELEDMEVEFPASPPWDPKTRPFGKLSRESSSIGL